MNLAITAVLADGPQIWPLEGPTIRIGRSRANAVCVLNGLISREHAEIAVKGNRLLLRDLRSENGTLLNGVPIRRATEVKVGDAIQVGPITFHIVSRPPGPVAQTESSNDLMSTIKVAMADAFGQGAGMGACLGEQIHLLEDAGRLLVQQRPLRGACEEFLRVVEKALPTTRLILYVFSEPDPEPIQIAARSRGQREVEPLVLSNDTVRAILEGRVVVMAAGGDKGVNPRKSPDGRTDARSAVAVPLVHEKKTLGLLYVDNEEPDFRYGRESVEILTLFANMAAVRIANDARLQVEKVIARIDHELAMASRIQQWLLPTRAPVVHGYDVHAMMETCEQVGGDFYDFQPGDDGMLWFMLGDVRGKGICAAIVMALVVSSARVLYEHCGGPGRLTTQLNTILCQRTEVGNFATAFLAVLEPETGTIRYVNAGHPYPLILHGRTIHELESTGPPLRTNADYVYESKSVTLDPGDFFALFTDGVPEAKRSGRFFGNRRTVRALRAAARCDDLPAAGRSIMAEVDEFLSGRPRSDDIALVLLRRARESG